MSAIHQIDAQLDTTRDIATQIAEQLARLEPADCAKRVAHILASQQAHFAAELSAWLRLANDADRARINAVRDLHAETTNADKRFAYARCINIMEGRK